MPLESFVKTFEGHSDLFYQILFFIVLLCCFANGTLTFRFFVLHFSLDTCKFWINHYSSTIFTNDNLFMHFNIKLSLWRYLIETTTTSITLNSNDTETVTCIFTNAF